MLLDISNGRWYSKSCFYSTSFVCEIYPNNTSISTIYPPSTNYPTTTTTTTTTATLKPTITFPQKPCGNGWDDIETGVSALVRSQRLGTMLQKHAIVRVEF
jgi:hypothetical protein